MFCHIQLLLIFDAVTVIVDILEQMCGDMLAECKVAELCTVHIYLHRVHTPFGNF